MAVIKTKNHQFFKDSAPLKINLIIIEYLLKKRLNSLILCKYEKFKIYLKIIKQHKRFW